MEKWAIIDYMLGDFWDKEGCVPGQCGQKIYCDKCMEFSNPDLTPPCIDHG